MNQRDQLRIWERKFISRLVKGGSKTVLRFLSILKCFDFTNIFRHHTSQNQQAFSRPPESNTYVIPKFLYFSCGILKGGVVLRLNRQFC